MNAADVLRSGERRAALILPTLIAASLLWGVGPMLWGVMSGALVGWGNIELIARLLLVVERSDGGMRSLLLMLLPVKMLAVAGVAYLFVVVLQVGAVGFLIGVSGGLLAIVLAFRHERGRLEATTDAETS